MPYVNLLSPSLPLRPLVPLFFPLSVQRPPLSWAAVAVVSREGAAHFPWRHHRIEQWAGWNVDGREGGRTGGGRTSDWRGGLWSSLSDPHSLRLPTLSLYSSDASAVGIHTSASLIRVSTCSHIMRTNTSCSYSKLWFSLSIL